MHPYTHIHTYILTCILRHACLYTWTCMHTHSLTCTHTHTHSLTIHTNTGKLPPDPWTYLFSFFFLFSLFSCFLASHFLFFWSHLPYFWQTALSQVMCILEMQACCCFSFWLQFWLCLSWKEIHVQTTLVRTVYASYLWVHTGICSATCGKILVHSESVDWMYFKCPHSFWAHSWYCVHKIILRETIILDQEILDTFKPNFLFRQCNKVFSHLNRGM